MKQDTVSFRVDVKKVKSLDALASALDRDRSYVLNEAISAYLELFRWQVGHIKKGMKQADVGEFATEQEVAKALRRRAP